MSNDYLFRLLPSSEQTGKTKKLLEDLVLTEEQTKIFLMLNFKTLASLIRISELPLTENHYGLLKSLRLKSYVIEEITAIALIPISPELKYLCWFLPPQDQSVATAVRIYQLNLTRNQYNAAISLLLHNNLSVVLEVVSKADIKEIHVKIFDEYSGPKSPGTLLQIVAMGEIDNYHYEAFKLLKSTNENELYLLKEISLLPIDWFSFQLFKMCGDYTIKSLESFVTQNYFLSTFQCAFGYKEMLSTENPVEEAPVTHSDAKMKEESHDVTIVGVVEEDNF